MYYPFSFGQQALTNHVQTWRGVHLGVLFLHVYLLVFKITTHASSYFSLSKIGSHGLPLVS